MKTLEQKYLCGYLPHGLETNEGTLIGITNWVGWCGVFKDAQGERHVPLSGIKPHFRPLSALAEQLPDGSVPIVELAKIAYNEFNWKFKLNECYTNDADFVNRISFEYSSLGFRLKYSDGGGDYCINQLQLFDYLYANHFDIHGLIDAGLAIDKRTIK